MKYLIFDFDGVLGDSKDVCDQALALIDGISIEEAREKNKVHFSKPTYSKSHSITEEKYNDIKDWINIYGKHINELGFALFADFIKEIEKIHDAKLAIVTSGVREYITCRISSINLKFTHVLDFNDHYSKTEKIEIICKDWGVKIDEVYYFIDTTRDVLELKDDLDFKKIIGCSWGFQNFHILRQVLPEDQILQKYKDIHKIEFKS